MMSTKQKIIELLYQHSGLSSRDLAEKLNRSPNGIRARISELRSLGFKIFRRENKYFLSSADKILFFVEKTKSYGIVLFYDELAEQLSLSVDEIKEGMAEIYRRGRLLQITSMSAKILV